MITYDSRDGRIIHKIPDDQDIDVFYYHYPQEFKDNLRCISLEQYPNDLHLYRVLNNELVRYTDEELREISIYNRILSEEERLLEKLKPSMDEVRKAEQTIEILSLIQEVL